MRHRLHIEQIDSAVPKLTIDGKDISAEKISVYFDKSCIPESDIKLYSAPDLEFDSLVTFDFSSMTYKSAMEVLKAGIINNKLEAFLAVNSLISEVEKRG